MGIGPARPVDVIISRYLNVLEREVYEPAIRDLESLKLEGKASKSQQDAADAAIEGMHNRMRSIRQRVSKELAKT